MASGRNVIGGVTFPVQRETVVLATEIESAIRDSVDRCIRSSLDIIQNNDSQRVLAERVDTVMDNGLVIGENQPYVEVLHPLYNQDLTISANRSYSEVIHPIYKQDLTISENHTMNEDVSRFIQSSLDFVPSNNFVNSVQSSMSESLTFTA